MLILKINKFVSQFFPCIWISKRKTNCSCYEAVGGVIDGLCQFERKKEKRKKDMRKEESNTSLANNELSYSIIIL